MQKFRTLSFKIFLTAVTLTAVTFMLAIIAAGPTNNMALIPDWISMAGGAAILVAMVSGPVAAVLWIWGKV